MKQYESLIIGHISLDYNVDHTGALVIEMGGAVLFSSASAYALGHKVAAVTKLAECEKDRLNKLILPKEDIYYIPSKLSTSIENIYHTPDKERRSCACKSQADPFTLSDIPDVDAKIYHFAGLIYGDYADGLIPELAKRGAVAVDVQGYLRHADKGDGHMYFEDWADKKTLLPYITYLKTDAAEAEILTGLTDRAEAAKLLYSWGAKEVLITHNTEVLAYDGKKIYTCPIKARNLSGRTGRGDTTFAAYINERLTHPIDEALLWATATVSKKMEKVGPITATRKDIQAYIDEFYK